MSFNCEFFKVEPWQLKLFLCPQTKKRFESIWGSTYDSRGDAMNAAKKIRTWLILTMGPDAGIWAADCSDHAEAVKISKDLKHSPLIPPGLWLSLIMGRYSFRNLQNCIQMSEKPNKIWLTLLLFTRPFSFFARIKILNLTTKKSMFYPSNRHLKLSNWNIIYPWSASVITGTGCLIPTVASASLIARAFLTNGIAPPDKGTNDKPRHAADPWFHLTGNIPIILLW